VAAMEGGMTGGYMCIGGGSLYACHQRRRRWWSGLCVNLDTIVDLVVLCTRGDEVVRWAMGPLGNYFWAVYDVLLWVL